MLHHGKAKRFLIINEDISKTWCSADEVFFFSLQAVGLRLLVVLTPYGSESHGEQGVCVQARARLWRAFVTYTKHEFRIGPLYYFPVTEVGRQRNHCSGSLHTGRSVVKSYSNHSTVTPTFQVPNTAPNIGIKTI